MLQWTLINAAKTGNYALSAMGESQLTTTLANYVETLIRHLKITNRKLRPKVGYRGKYTEAHNCNQLWKSVLSFTEGHWVELQKLREQSAEQSGDGNKKSTSFSCLKFMRSTTMKLVGADHFNRGKPGLAYLSTARFSKGPCPAYLTGTQNAIP